MAGIIHALTCGGKWTKNGRKVYGVQQFKCSKCGRLENRKVKPCFMFHQYKWDKRNAKGILTCKLCGKKKDTRSADQILIDTRAKRQRTRNNA